MRVSNNNSQTNFGMRAFVPWSYLPKNLAKTVDGITPQALKLGNPAYIGFIVRNSSGKITVRVATRTGEYSYVAGQAKGRIGRSNKGAKLLELLRQAKDNMEKRLGKAQPCSIGDLNEDMSFLADPKSAMVRTVLAQINEEIKIKPLIEPIVWQKFLEISSSSN